MKLTQIRKKLDKKVESLPSEKSIKFESQYQYLKSLTVKSQRYTHYHLLKKKTKINLIDQQTVIYQITKTILQLMKINLIQHQH